MENFTTIPVNGMPIFTRSTGESDKAIIFIHGGLQQSDIWDEQLKDELLQEQFRLIAPDLPGHGRSGRSTAPERDYSIAGMARQLADYINASTLENYVLVGISSGTNLISEALPLLSQPPKGLFFAGAAIGNHDTPWASVLLSSPYEQVLTETPSDAALTAYSKKLVYRPTDQFIAGCKQYYYDTDPVFRTTFGRYMRADGANHIDGLQHSELPLCLVMGQQENVVRLNYLDGVSFKRKWKDTIFKVPAAGHLVNYDQPQIFNHLLWQFAEEVLNK
ncbi:alpha/beta fold hydrolase [Chitinophaga rupis]|nr:alpha/beta hydrolase [Chitinophaga rupis]